MHVSCYHAHNLIFGNANVRQQQRDSRGKPKTTTTKYAVVGQRFYHDSTSLRSVRQLCSMTGWRGHRALLMATFHLSALCDTTSPAAVPVVDPLSRSGHACREFSMGKKFNGNPLAVYREYSSNSSPSPSACSSHPKPTTHGP